MAANGKMGTEVFELLIRRFVRKRILGNELSEEGFNDSIHKAASGTRRSSDDNICVQLPSL